MLLIGDLASIKRCQASREVKSHRLLWLWEPLLHACRQTDLLIAQIARGLGVKGFVIEPFMPLRIYDECDGIMDILPIRVHLVIHVVQVVDGFKLLRCSGKEKPLV